jgi:large subunit ribosomal protein L15
MRDAIKKLPKLRGHGKNRSKSVFVRGPEAVVNVSALNVFTAGDVVNPSSLLAKGLIPRVVGKFPKVKILGTGELSVKVSVEGCTISESAKVKIEKVGGSFTRIPDVEHSVAQAKVSADKKAKTLEKKSLSKGGKKK